MTSGEHDMPKAKKSNREEKKRPLLTKKEKRAAKKSKGDASPLVSSVNR